MIVPTTLFLALLLPTMQPSAIQDAARRMWQRQEAEQHITYAKAKGT